MQTDQRFPNVCQDVCQLLLGIGILTREPGDSYD